MTRVYFVRHAQTDYRVGTDRDRPLTAAGLEDRRVVLDFFSDKDIRTDERLRERETVPGGNCRELFRKRWADFDWHEPGGESLRSVQRRNIAALTDILTAEDGKNIVIGTHGTALSTVLNYFDPGFGCDDFLRIIDWMPYIIELDFEGTRYLTRTEHVHVE